MPVNFDLWTYLQVIAIDLVMSGDNAVVIGMAVAGLPVAMRRRAIMIGILAAAGIRIAMSLVAIRLLAVPGILIVGGMLLLWVCWTMLRELLAKRRARKEAAGATAQEPPDKTLRQAVTQIIVADVSMSLDNVLAVAGAARSDPRALIFGLTLSVLLMAVASTFIARLLNRHRWIGWIGLIIIFYVALEMLYEGWPDIQKLMKA